MNKQQAIEVAKGYFENHKVDVFFVAKDKQVFFTKQDADNHASSFPKDDREVIEVKREECFVQEKKEKVAASESATEKADKKAKSSAS